MTDWMRVLRCTVATIGAAGLLAGCGPGGGGAAATAVSSVAATPTLASKAPTSIDGCHLAQSYIEAEHLDPQDASSPADRTDTQSGDAVWSGCQWTSYDGDGFGVDISTTNLTIPKVEANTNFTIAEHLTIDGRQAITYHHTGDADLRANCLLHVEIKGGGLEFSVTNPAERKATGTQDSCEIAKSLAGGLVPTLPPSA